MADFKYVLDLVQISLSALKGPTESLACQLIPYFGPKYFHLKTFKSRFVFVSKA